MPSTPWRGGGGDSSRVCARFDSAEIERRRSGNDHRDRRQTLAPFQPAPDQTDNRGQSGCIIGHRTKARIRPGETMSDTATSLRRKIATAGDSNPWRTMKAMAAAASGNTRTRCAPDDYYRAVTGLPYGFGRVDHQVPGREWLGRKQARSARSCSVPTRLVGQFNERWWSLPWICWKLPGKKPSGRSANASVRFADTGIQQERIYPAEFHQRSRRWSGRYWPRSRSFAKKAGSRRFTFCITAPSPARSIPRSASGCCRWTKCGDAI